MANEVTVPLLPCASIDDIETFYEVLGFRTTYKQRKPNACVGVQREDLDLQFFEIAGFDPEQVRSISTEAFLERFPLPARRPADSTLRNLRAAALGITLRDWREAVEEYVPRLAAGRV